ncbi:MAG: FAD-dependent oxidoreductase [Clostridia bacterium]|nr:FAD-dependent oxidoreductase [Clostridia bacterium]
MESVLLNKNIPVVSSADVVVTGGGLGGVAAAIAAARAGASVVLLETNGFLGGVATAGMCCSVCNCLFTRSRELKVHGIPLEIADKLATEAGGPGMSWRKHKGHIIYDVEKAKLVLAQLVKSEGVELRFNSPVADVIVEEGRVQAVITSGKNGLEAIKCKVLVDSTGDCDSAILAGSEYTCYGRPRASYVFRLGNVDVDKFINYFRQNPEQFPGNMDLEWTVDEAIRQYDENGTFLFPHGGGMQFSLIANAIEKGDLSKEWKRYDTLNAMQMHLIKKTGVCHIITGYVENDNLDAANLSVNITEGMEIAQMFAECFRKNIPGFENAFVNNQADDLGVRVSRCIKGLKAFKNEMRKMPYRCEDAVGIGVMMEEKVLHGGKGAWSAQVFGDDVYEIPMSCLIPENLQNVIIGAGRGADTEPPGTLRVMVDTMSVGQGAGTVAAVAAKNKTTIAEVNYQAVRSELEKRGVVFPSEKTQQ